MKRFNEDGTERTEFLEWKAAHDNYVARKKGFNTHSEYAEHKEEAKKGKSVVEMLKAMTGGIMGKVQANRGKQASKKSAGAAVKHLRQKV
jgi:hypothetical protein